MYEPPQKRKKPSDILPADTNNASNTTDDNFILESMGTTFKLGETRFFSEVPLYMVELDDYSLIVNDDTAIESLKAHVPRSIKEKLEPRWHYAVHLPQMQLAVTKKLLRDRVDGGEILAYKYTEGNIEGNVCCYYGFIPTLTHSDDSIIDDSHKINNSVAFHSRGTTHRVCRITTKAIWPRKLYVYMKRTYKCPCSDDCHLWQVMVRNSKDVHTFCLKKMPWSSIYVMMGDTDANTVDTVKDLRVCPVCAQCFQCSKSTTFCRRHRKCKHKKSVLFELNNSTLVADSSIKLCRKAKHY